MQVKCQPSQNRELPVSINFDKANIKLEYTLIGVVVQLAGCITAGAPGGPALPQCTIRIALPPGNRLTNVKTETQGTEKLTTGILPIAPLQLLRPAQQREMPPYNRPNEERRGHNYIAGNPQHEEQPFIKPFPVPAYTPPNTDLYTQAIRRQSAQVLATAEEGMNQVVTVALNPVKLTEEGLLEFNTRIDITLYFEPSKNNTQETSPKFGSRAQAMRQAALTRMTVINPDLIVDISDFLPVYALYFDYLIITDNQRWNAQTIEPAGMAAGNVVASFERLAAWKRQRGIRARVVTISEIVANRYGNFVTGSRDLQEVLRRFLKMAQADWGVAWVLLGGDTEIVPVRKVAGSREGNVNRDATNPPADNTSFWTGSYLRMHVVNPGTWWGASADNLLVRPDNGLLVPYDSAGTSGPASRGWYFTTDNNYNMRSATPTNFVRVNGPAGEVNADLQFLYEWNTIPTDLYYSSLVGPGYNQPGKHDWDLTDNGVYGQHASGNELDGINYTPTISLGRAPVRNAAEADTFVNKVIAYEKFQRPDGTRLDDEWTKKVVLVSENWGGRLWISSTTDNPPGDNTYLHIAGQNYSVINLQDTPNWDWSLLAYIAEADVRLLPYRTDAAAAGRGWHFAVSNTNLSPNMFMLSLPNGTIIRFPMPSQWIVVYGTAEELTPSGYIFNNIELDGSLADQDQLRRLLQNETGFYKIKRLYEDLQDMTPTDVSATPLELITTVGLTNALNEGPHIVSLSGHGSGWGCCKLGQDVADSLTNGYYTFIAYADSCLTNQFDGDSMSEHLLKNTNGGAVAYIGSSRFSWISAGDDIQRRFFHEWSSLAGNAHIGLLFDTRAAFVNSFYWADGRWSILALNLMGDPEMPLWWREPFVFRIPEVYLFDKLKIVVDPPEPPFNQFELPYVKNWGLTHVHLQQGRQEQTVLAEAGVNAEVSLKDFKSGPATLTVSRPGYQPVVQQVKITRRQTRIRNEPLLFAILALSALVIATAVTNVRRKRK
jgi:hypothetical protein